METGDFSGGPVVQSPPCNAGGVAPMPCQGTKIPYALSQLSTCCEWGAYLASPGAATNIPHDAKKICATVKTQAAKNV